MTPYRDENRDEGVHRPGARSYVFLLFTVDKYQIDKSTVHGDVNPYNDSMTIGFRRITRVEKAF